ncbi:MAG: WXG100 family type VII secretion target [Gemmiger formicilis]|uniref:WXG100 family type VII secretion target n=1 Tax=Gemmiger formicilis TaxID=745368 RepID=UPI003FEFA92B|nr:WXG100 family type VII secretion target [Gemmiger formicilis]
MAIIRVTAAELRNGAQELRDLNQRFKSSVSELETTEGALNTMWEGDARNAFHQAFTSDKTQMNNFYNAIEVYAQRLEAAAAKYEQAEAQNVEIANTRSYT